MMAPINRRMCTYKQVLPCLLLENRFAYECGL